MVGTFPLPIQARWDYSQCIQWQAYALPNPIVLSGAYSLEKPV